MEPDEAAEDASGRRLNVLAQEAPHEPGSRDGARLPGVGRQTSRQLMAAAEDLDVLDGRALSAVVPAVALGPRRDAADRPVTVAAVAPAPGVKPGPDRTRTGGRGAVVGD